MSKRHLMGLTLALAIGAAGAPASAADIVIYDALDFVGTVAKAFTAKTGITVNVVEPGSTGETLGKIAAEGDNPQFDLVWIDGSAVLERMLQDHVLQPVPEATFAAVKFNALGKSLAPANRAFLPTGASTTAIEINSKKVPEAEWPHSWSELAKFKGSVAAKDPNLSGPAYQWLAGFFQTNGVEPGKELLKSVLTNHAFSALSSGGKINKEVITGEAKIGVNQDSSIIAKQIAGEPVVAVYPKEGSVALLQGLAISAKTKHLEQVVKFMEFVVSAEGQAAQQNGKDTDFYYIPLVEGVEAKKGRKTDINFVKLDDKLAAAHETEWKHWYRDTFVK